MAQAALPAHRWGLAQSWERDKVPPKKKRLKNVSCAPLRGPGGLLNSYRKFGAYVEKQMLSMPGGDKGVSPIRQQLEASTRSAWRAASATLGSWSVLNGWIS